MQGEFDLLKQLPCITAEMSAAYGALPRSSIVYLRDPQRDLDKLTAECYGFDHASSPVKEFVPWGDLRHVQIRRVLTSVGKHCQRMTREEFEEVVERIQRERVLPIDDFGTGLDDLE